MRDRHYALAGLQRELLDDALRHCRVIEGEPRLRERVRPGENDQNDEDEDALHVGHYRLTVARSFQGRGWRGHRDTITTWRSCRWIVSQSRSVICRSSTRCLCR